MGRSTFVIQSPYQPFESVPCIKSGIIWRTAVFVLITYKYEFQSQAVTGQSGWTWWCCHRVIPNQKHDKNQWCAETHCGVSMRKQNLHLFNISGFANDLYQYCHKSFRLGFNGHLLLALMVESNGIGFGFLLDEKEKRWGLDVWEYLKH